MTKNQYLLFVDVECTGFPTRGGYLSHDILTWSGIITDRKFNIKDKITVKSRADSVQFWSEEAEEKHGISLLEAIRFQDPRNACLEIMSFLDPFRSEDNSPLIWVEHSLSWIDILFTQGLFIKNDLDYSLSRVVDRSFEISTIKLGRHFGEPKNDLKIWAEKLNFKLDHHNSASDAHCCYLILKHLANGDLTDEKAADFINLSKNKGNQS